MTQDLNTEIKIGADASGVEAGVASAKRSLAGLGQSAEQVGRTGGEGLKKIGAGGEEAARRLDSVTKNMVASLQRQIAAAEAGGTATRQYQESIARLRGADVNALKPYLDQLDAARDKAEKAAKANAGLEGSMGRLGGVAALASSALAAVAGSITLGAITGFVRGVNDGVDALNDIKDATGSTIENISALEDVALRTGHSMDTVTTAMVKFNQVLSDAKPGSSQELALKAIGLSAKELRALDPAEALLKTAQALTQYEDDANKARLVQELFGKSIREVVPFLNDLAEKGVLVAKVTTEQAEEAAKFAKSLSELEKNTTDAGRALVNGMLPSLNQITKAMREGAIEGGTLLSIYRGIAEFSAIAFGTDKLGKDITQAKTATAEMARLSNMMIGVQQVLDRDPENATAQRRFANLRAQLEEVSRKATAASEAIKGVVGVTVSEAAEPAKPSVGDVPDATALKAASDAAKKAAEERKKELQEQAKLMAELSGLTGSFAEDWNRLTAVYKAGGMSLEQYTKAQADLLAKQPGIKAAADAEVKAKEAIAKANLEAAQTHERYIASLLSGVEKTRADVAAQEEATRRMGLSKEAVAELDAAKLEMLATDLELQAIKEMDRNLDEQAYNALKAQAQAYRELASAKRAGAAKEQQLDMDKASAEAARKAAEEWQRTADKIEDSITDALMRGFESGKDFAKNLRDTIANMFKTLVLRPVISAVVNPIAGAVSGVVNGAVGSIGSSMLSSAGGSFLGNTFGSMSGLGSGFMSGMSETLLGSSFVGPSATAASGATGIGASLGTIAPYALAAVALYSIIKSLDDSGTYHTGGAAQYNATSGLSSGQSGANYNIGFGRVESGAETISAVGTIAKSLGTALDGIAVAFGQKAGYEVATAFADDTSKDGAWGALRISKDGKDLLNWEDTRMSKWAPKEFGDGQAGYQQYLAAIAKDTRQVLLDMDLPSWADTMLTSIGDSASMEDLSAVLTQIGVVQTAFVQLGQSIDGFADMTDKAFESIMAASGGIDALASSASTYYSNFYSQDERTSKAREQVQAQLSDLGIDNFNFDDPKAREQYRTAVEAALQRANDQAANRDAVASALAGMDLQSITSGVISDALAGLGGQGEATPEALQGLASSIAELGASATGLDDFKQSITDYIAANAEALGIEDDAAAAAAALLGLSGSIADLTQSSEDATAAAEAQAQAAQSQAMRNLQAAYDRERKVLESQLDGLAQSRSYFEQQQSLQQESLSLITGIFDLVRSNAQELYGEVQSTSAMQAVQGQLFIEQALASAQSTGYLPEQQALQEAISAARAGVANGAYVSQFERDRDTLVLAGRLSGIEAISGKQKTAAEQQLEAMQQQLDSIDAQTEAINQQLDMQRQVLDYWQEQIDIANGVYDATMSVAQAVSDLADSLGIELIANNKTPYLEGSKPSGSGGQSGATFGGSAGNGGGAAQEPSRYSRVFSAGTAGVGYEPIRDQSVIAHLDKLSPVYHSFDGTGDLPGLAAAIKAAGGSIGDLSILSGFFESDWVAAFAKVGIPAFAEGGMHSGGLRLVGERGWEVEATGPARYWNQQQLGSALAGGGGDMAQELRELRREVSLLREEAGKTATSTGAMAEQFDRVTAGGNAMRSKAIA